MANVDFYEGNVQLDLEATTARYGQLLAYANAVTTNDFDRCVSKMVNRLASLSQTEILRSLFSISMADMAVSRRMGLIFPISESPLYVFRSHSEKLTTKIRPTIDR